MIDLRHGDVFATQNPWIFGRAINLAQRIWSHDGESKYSHAGIITDQDGSTIESLWTVTRQNIFKDYAGKAVIIARPAVTDADKRAAILRIRREHMGDKYPIWRLLFHLFPPVAKYFSAGGRYLVCSELVAKYLFLCGARHGQVTGTNPDTLADEWIHWKNFDVVFEGVLPKE